MRALGFGTVRKQHVLPPLGLQAQPDAAVLDVGDATTEDQRRPRRVEAPHGSLTARPKRKPFKKGAPIESAIAAEVAEQRRARDDASEAAAELYGVRGRKPFPPSSATTASSSARLPRQGGGRTGAVADAAASAAIQGVFSQQAGLDTPRARGETGSFPRSKLSYRHDSPQPNKSPHVSVAAIEGIVNGVAPPPDLLAWSSRTTQPREGGFEHVVKGSSAIVIGEVEKLLAECGVTAELMTDAGLSTDESKRLLYALYVHSSGFLQFLADSFSDLPQRQTLLKHVWAGFATLIERAEIAGAEGVGYSSVMAALSLEMRTIRDELQAELKRTTAFLQGELATSREQEVTTEKLRVEQQQRAETAEALEHETAAARDSFKAQLERTSEELRKMTLEKEKLERDLEAEKKALEPLRAQAAALQGARTEAKSAQALAKKRQAELASALEIKEQLSAALTLEEVAVSTMRMELAGCDRTLTRARKAHEELAATRDAIAAKAAEDVRDLEEKLKKEKALGKAQEEKNKKLRAQMEEIDASAAQERKARLQAQERITLLTEELEETRTDLEAKEQMAAENLKRVEELKIELEVSENSKVELNVTIDSLKRKAANAEKEKELAVEELADAQKRNRQLISDLKGAREEAKVCKNELDQLTLKSFRDCEMLRSELQKEIAEKEAALAETEEAKEQVVHWEDRVTLLENDAQKHRLAIVEREKAHEESLLDAQKHLLKAQRTDNEALTRLHKQGVEDSKVLQLACDDVNEIGKLIDELRQDVARLTNDNMAYAAEVDAYEEAMTCRFELHATLDQGAAISTLLGALYEDVRDQLALQSDQQRAIDATHLAMGGVLSAVDDLNALSAEMLQPLVDEAADSHRELPLIREELLQTSLQRTETLSKLRMAQDAADAERQQSQREVQMISKQAAQQKEEADFAMKIKQEQLELALAELAEANEELANWRSGNIRLSNAKAWREQRAGSTTPGATPGVSSPIGRVQQGGLSGTGTAPGTPDLRMGSPDRAQRPPDLGRTGSPRRDTSPLGARPGASHEQANSAALRYKRGGQGVEAVTEE